MFYDVSQAISACDDDPSLIFEVIKENYRDVIEKVIEKENYNFNICDSDGNNVLMRLLKNKDYDLVLKYMDSPYFDINHQNYDGDTFAHILVMINYVLVGDIINKLLDNRKFIPNIKNNFGETILDKSINNNYIYTTAKILSDKRFNNINLASFKHLYETYIKSNNYGTYSKLNNFTLIVDNLTSKDLLPTMEKLIELIRKNQEAIKNDFFMLKTNNLDVIIDHVIEETIQFLFLYKESEIVNINKGGIMKKILIFIFGLLLLTGCDNLMNTPTKRVENLLSKYQKQDAEVLSQLDETMLNETILTTTQKDRYKNLMTRQYKDLAYTVKNETIDGKTAVVEVEVQVYDYNKAITASEQHLLNNQKDFLDDTGNVNTNNYNEYKIKQMEDMNDKTTYTINFTLSKIEDKWVVDDLTETERMKIHGLYAY